MHTTNLDISLEEITKIEGTAELKLKIREGVVTECKFGITEMKRFFTSAIKGKPVIAVPQLVARICGTCSNAHLLCSIASLENGLGVPPSPQTILLRKLLNYGLIIRDHGLHLYVFVLPDLYQKNSILEFDEHDEAQHQLLHDCFDVNRRQVSPCSICNYWWFYEIANQRRTYEFNSPAYQSPAADHRINWYIFTISGNASGTV